MYRICFYDNSLRTVAYPNGQHQPRWICERKRDITLHNFQDHSCNLDVFYGPFSSSNIWLGNVPSGNIRSRVSFTNVIGADFFRHTLQTHMTNN